MIQRHVGSLISDATARGLTRFDAQRLMSHVLAQPRAWLIAHDDAAIDDVQWACFEQLVARRLDDEPVAYLLGEKEFYGLSFEVTPAVLVPRSDTELLLEWALECITARQLSLARQVDVVDLGSGSGALAITIATKATRHDAEVAVSGVDVSADALEVAHRNARRHRVDIDWQLGSWWSPLAKRQFDVALSNPPYIAAADSHLPALRHEPALALIAGVDGLDALRAIIGDASSHLRSDAWLLVEHGFDQAAAVRMLFVASGFVHVQTRRDGQAHERCTGGQWRA